MPYFDHDYLERATLRDGSEVVLRLLRPEDKDRLRDGFRRLSPESRYRRFFTPKNDLTDDELRYLTEIDQWCHFALGVERETPDGLEGLGVARFIQLAAPEGTAEAAIAVLDEMQGKGLGSLLFQRLVAAARERGVERMRCEVLGSNQAMYKFLQSLATDARTHVDGGVVCVEFDLPALSPDHPYAEPPRESGLYKLFSAAARGVLEMRAAVARLVLGLGPDVDLSIDDTHDE